MVSAEEIRKYLRDIGKRGYSSYLIQDQYNPQDPGTKLDKLNDIIKERFGNN